MMGNIKLCDVQYQLLALIGSEVRNCEENSSSLASDMFSKYKPVC